MKQNKHNQVHTIQNGNSEYKIAKLLPVGKKNAISTQRLVELSGCHSARELQQCIAEERSKGAIICSCATGGYFLPANREETEEFCEVLEKRAKNTLMALRSAKRSLRMTEGQQSFDDLAIREQVEIKGK